VDETEASVQALKSTKRTIVSINRFERKKNIPLAIKALGILKRYPEFHDVRLIVAGGYDERVRENVEHLLELEQLAHELDLSTCVLRNGDFDNTASPTDADVLFLPSFTEAQRTYLFHIATCLLYTPSKEHFGIVPVESMYARVPVIAVHDGGPTESILDGETGYLCAPEPEAFAKHTRFILKMSDVDRAKMGMQARTWVMGKFGLTVFVERMDAVLREMVASSTSPVRTFWYVYVVFGLLISILGVWWYKV
jgi:alpha-1,3/alpha-1,6-mannosyltransferase